MERKPVAGTAVVASRSIEGALEDLTKEEAARRKRLEVVVKDGLSTFREVGDALSEIRDSRLYRNTHASFEQYCREVWGISKTHANRLIASSEVAETLAEIGPVPSNESALRPLTKLKPNEQKRVWERIKETVDNPGTCSANIITRIINETLHPMRKRGGGKAGNEYSPSVPRLTLAQKHEVQSKIIEWWAAREQSGESITPKDIIQGIKAVIASL